MNPTSPALTPYAITCILLCANLIFLWVFSGAARNKTKATPNPEDAAHFKATLADMDPPEIRRVLRAHANAQAMNVPFVILGLIYVLIGGPAGPATLYFAVFTLARWLHSWAYLASKQPLRTVFFTISAIPLVTLLGHDAWLVAMH